MDPSESYLIESHQERQNGATIERARFFTVAYPESPRQPRSRDRAIEAADEGRLHDALIDLTDAGTTPAQAGIVIEKVVTDLQTASVHAWLRDYERALATHEAVHGNPHPSRPLDRRRQRTRLRHHQ